MEPVLGFIIDEPLPFSAELIPAEYWQVGINHALDYSLDDILPVGELATFFTKPIAIWYGRITVHPLQQWISSKEPCL
jgi:hypothetical protein